MMMKVCIVIGLMIQTNIIYRVTACETHDTPIILHRQWHILISINSFTVTPSNNHYTLQNFA